MWRLSLVFIAASVLVAADLRAAVAHRLFSRPLHDPAGDALNIFGSSGPPVDLKRVDVTIVTADTTTTVAVRMKFFGRIRPPSSAPPGSSDLHRARILNGFIEIGEPLFSIGLPGAAQNEFSPPLAPVIFATRGSFDFFSEASHPGYVEFREFAPNGGIVQQHTLCPIEYRTRSVVTSVELLGFPPGSLLPTHFAALVGNYFGPTDAPQELGNIHYMVPAPSGAAILLAGALASARRRRS